MVAGVDAVALHQHRHGRIFRHSGSGPARGPNLPVYPAVTVTVCVFITAGPIIKLFTGGEEESGGHVL